jgi:hypothetical protein
MRLVHIPLALSVALVLPMTAIAGDGVAIVNGRFDLARPVYAAQTRSWSSPLAVDASSGDHETRRVLSGTFSEPRRYGVATEWISRAAVFALAATGNIRGDGRDDTGDIGRRPLPTTASGLHPFGRFSGGIR